MNISEQVYNLFSQTRYINENTLINILFLG